MSLQYLDVVRPAYLPYQLPETKRKVSPQCRLAVLRDEYKVVSAIYTSYAMIYGSLASIHSFKEKLMKGEPRLAYDGSTVRVPCLRDGEEILVARRLREFFEKILQ